VSSDPVVEPAVLVREIYGTQFPSLNRYVDILRSTGVEWGLLGPREADRLWDRHILNCAALNELIAADRTVADVGSGAGLPGIPLALLRPDLHVTLIEPLLRRSTFLTQTVEGLGLGRRVRVIRSRAEDHHQTYDVVVSRALAPLDRLIGWCNPLRSRGGIILALKGSSAANEVKAAETELRATHLNAEVVKAQAHATAEPATVVRLTPRRTQKR
jgi:16S rRNA (guanine527-N7)-methyltransferase